MSGQRLNPLRPRDGDRSTEKFASFIKAEQVKCAQVATDAKVRADA